MKRRATSTFISLTNAAKLYPSADGDGVSPRTPYRHATDGVRGVRLKTIKSGGRTFTTEAYVHDFLETLNRDARSVQPHENIRGDS